MRNKKASRNTSVLMIVVCLTLGFILAQQMKNISTLKSLNLFGNNDLQSLQQQVQNLTNANNELRMRNQTLNENLEEIIQVGSDDNAQIKYYQQQIKNLSIFAGLTAVKGTGIIIDIDTSKTQNELSYSTLLVLINQLLASGVYAISINGQRVVSTTAITNTGQEGNIRLIMNGVDITNADGYEVRVISEVEKMREFTVFHKSVWETLSSKGIAVTFHYPTEVEIPALPADSPAYRTQLLEELEVK